MKFKVGDLVQLSAAGKKVDQNSHALGGWGIIHFIGGSHSEFPIYAEWYGGEHWATGQKRTIHFKPYELKFFKKFS